MPRRYSDLVIVTEMLSRQVVGTRLALARQRKAYYHLDRENTVMQRQVERANDVMTNNKVLREEIVELKKQIFEEKEVADKLRRSSGSSRNKLRTEVGLLTLEKTYLEGALQETLAGVDAHYARLEVLALSMLEVLGEVRGAEQ